MRVDKITASNFRTLVDFSIQLDPHYCALSGKNNAGKSAIASIIEYFLTEDDDYGFDPYSRAISFTKDVTQWANAPSMHVSICLTIDKVEDSEVFFFIEKFCSKPLDGETASVLLTGAFTKETSEFQCKINSEVLENRNGSEVLKKLRSSSNLIIHNSTRPNRHVYYVNDSYTEILETDFSLEDRSRIADAQTRLQNSVKRAAKQHKEALDKLLGMLNEKYEVELSSVDGGRSSKFPLEIKLTDRRVHVPLRDWGAGTQNRTRILISVLEAIRSRDSATDDNRNTPVFIVEEPESFLHPSAQAEFGQVLNALAQELDVQIITTTHSPYMLNQSNPCANYLLERRISRGIPKESILRDTSGADWMLPFAENLGIIPEEFSSWKHLFGTQKTNVILVEGEIDRAYFEHMRSDYPEIYSVPDDAEIVSYGGKDALKNTPILQFMINKFTKVFITFDLDAESEVVKPLERIGLKKDIDFCAIGIAKPGSECIEGLLPAEIKQKVYATHHDTVTALGSQDSNARRGAKSRLKQECLAEFKKARLNIKDLKGYKAMFDKVATKFK